MRLPRLLFTLFSSFAVLLSAWLPTYADSNWTNPDGGDFGDASSWSTGVPAGGEWAFFGPNKSDPGDGDSYTVHLDQNRTLAGLYFNAGDKAELTLDLGGYTLTTTSTDTTDHGFHIDGTSDYARTIHLLNGELTVGSVRIAQHLNRQANLIIGDGAILRTAAGEGSRLGNSGDGVLRVEGSGRVDTGVLFSIGAGSSSSGHVIVDGPEASFTGSSNLLIGTAGQGQMDVINGATVDRSGHVHVGHEPSGVGLLQVNSGSSFTISGSIRLGGRNNEGTAVGGTGHAIFSGGAAVRSGFFIIFSGNILEIDNATLTVTHAGFSNWFAGGTYRIHLNAEDATPVTVNNLNLGGTILDVQLGDDFVPEIGNYYTLIDYSGSLNGQFVDAEEETLVNGTQITIGDHVFRLDYGSGENSLVSLELIPEPSAFVLVSGLLIISLLLLRHRRN